MIQRQWNSEGLSLLKDAFFETSIEPIYWVDNANRRHKITGQKAIIDITTGKSISVVSSQYNFVRNQEAYEIADFIVQRIFEGMTLQQFECYNVYMPKSKGSCRIDLIIPYSKDNPFADKKDTWTPFIRISNSYNRTLVLKYEIGFCRWICKNGAIFGQKGITISINHSKRIDSRRIQYEIEHMENVIGVRSLMSEFLEKMEMLKSLKLPESIALQMYCKAFGIKVDKKKVTPRQREILGQSAKRIVDAAKEYFAEMGNNAYAIFNVLSDIASFPVAYGNQSIFIHGLQRKVGLWAEEFIHEAKKSDFSLYKYIGEEATNTAFFMESLIKNENGIL
ncbi:MAG: DUF932 domain-containing protein [Muribaculaceae bacterium]